MECQCNFSLLATFSPVECWALQATFLKQKNPSSVPADRERAGKGSHRLIHYVSRRVWNSNGRDQEIGGSVLEERSRMYAAASLGLLPTLASVGFAVRVPRQAVVVTTYE